jgi:pentatricopeptide repeat protein
MIRNNIHPDEIVFNTLLDGCSKCELLKEIEIVINLMQESRLNPGTVSYNSIIDGYVRCKQFWKAYNC